MDLKKIRIREDEYFKDEFEGFHCNECNTKFKNKDIVLELDLYESYWRFCSEKCLLVWLDSDIEKKEVEIYPMPDEVKFRRELEDILNKIEPNTSITVENIRIEYYNTKGLTEHYVIYDEILKRYSYFLSKFQVIDYIVDTPIK